MIYRTLEKVHIIRNRLKTAYSRQKSYADNRRREFEFEEGDKVHSKISPMKGEMKFFKKGMLSPRYMGPYEILQRVGKFAYELRSPRELSSVHLVFHVSRPASTPYNLGQPFGRNMTYLTSRRYFTRHLTSLHNITYK